MPAEQKFASDTKVQSVIC